MKNQKQIQIRLSEGEYKLMMNAILIDRANMTACARRAVTEAARDNFTREADELGELACTIEAQR